MNFSETWFYAPIGEGTTTAQLPDDEAHHARVLRLKPGAGVVVTTGEGSVYRAILRDDKGGLEIVERVLHEAEPPRLGVGLPLLKGRDTELPGEAVCEFAVRDLFLLNLEHCETFKGQDHTKLVERLRAKSLVALKQAKKAWLARIHAPQTLKEWRAAHASTPLVVAHPGETTVPRPLPPSLHLLTGPEGGFSAAELALLFEEAKAYRLSLGETRLRAIHAPVAGLGALGALG